LTAASISLDTAPPVVVRTVPIAGATDVDPALRDIAVTFSKPMQDGSWSWSTWGEQFYPETTGRPHYQPDGRTCVLPVKLEPGRFYAIWLNSDQFKNFKDSSGQPAVPYLLTFRTANTGGAVVSTGAGPVIERATGGRDEVRVEGRAVTSGPIERTLDKAVSDFPPGEDLSTPEGACAAWQRASARKDVEALARMSLVPLDVNEQRAWYEREAQRDPEGLAMYLKAVADSRMVTVQVWRGELANVITYLPFPEGKGRQPYSARAFGLVNGQWRNLGEDRWPDLAAAQAGFESRKERAWDYFTGLKNAARATDATTGSPASTTFESIPQLNEDQRAVIAWTDRQFRSYYDNRTFDGWSDAEIKALEAKCIDALNGPRSREYYAAINTLGALHSTNGLSRLRELAFERVDKNNRDRWMAVRVLGMLGDRQSVPDLIHLVYHGNPNTHWWSQIALVHITGQNFGGDWEAWGRWWNESGGQPLYSGEIIRWWNGQAETVGDLKTVLAEGDEKFIKDIRDQ
jgi:RNA polymerase sigma-70 factor (ECF subfamily)